MITIEQLKEVRERTEQLHRYLNIDAKKIQLEEEQLRTQAPGFWDDQKRAEAQMKLVKGLEKWIKGYGQVQSLCDELELAFEYYKEELVTETEVDELYNRTTEAIENLHSKMKHKDSVIFTGRLENKELSMVMAAAECLTYIPHFEGFGIPLLEAMYSETAIICGNTTSLPEVVGDAALICSATDYNAVAENMYRIIGDEELRTSLIEKGRKQRQKFSWQLTSERLWNCIEKALKLC